MATRKNGNKKVKLRCILKNVLKQNDVIANAMHGNYNEGCCNHESKSEIVPASRFNEAFMKLIIQDIELSEQEQLLENECKLLNEVIDEFESKGKALKQSLHVILNKSNQPEESTDKTKEIVCTSQRNNESLTTLCQEFKNCLSDYNKQVSPRFAIGCDPDGLKCQLEDVLSSTAPLNLPESLNLMNEAPSDPS